MQYEIHNMDCIAAMRAMPDNSVDLILCDLPYGTTQNKWDSIIPFEDLWAAYNRIIKSNGAVVLTAQAPFDKVLGASNIGMLKYEWIWQKDNGTGFLNAKRAPLKTHENILVFYREPPTYNPQMRQGFRPYTQKQGSSSKNYGAVTPGHVTENNGQRYPVTILEFPRDKDKQHPTQKPVALMEYLIRTYTNEGELVLDNCMGSGTTGVAAMRAGRRFIGIERDEKYFQIAEQRIVAEMTGGML